MKNNTPNHQSQFPQMPGQPDRAIGQDSGPAVSQKPKRRRVRTYEKILADPFILTC